MGKPVPSYNTLVLPIVSLAFGPAELVCDTTCENGLNHTALFVDGEGRVHVAYHRKLGGVWQVFYRMRDSYGWLPPERVVFTDTADAKYPSLAILRDSVFLVWHDYRVGGISNVELFFNAKPIYGDTWANEERLTYTSSGSPGDNSYVPSLKVVGESLRVVWYDYRDDPMAYDAEVYTKVRGPSGWGGDVRVSNSPENAWYPSFASSGDSVLYVWADNRDGGYHIYGNFGSGDFPIGGPGYYPDATYGHGRYVVVWQGGDGNVYIAFRDTVWHPPRPLLPRGNPQKSPTVSTSPYGFVVAWREDYGPYDSDIVGVLLRPDLSLRDTFRVSQPGTQDRPNLFVGPEGYVHMTYVDYSYGSSYPRIFYVRSLSPADLSERPKAKDKEIRNRIRGRRVILRGRYDPAGRRLP